MKPITAIYRELKTPKKIVITMHHNPDADAMGSSLGLYHFLIQLGHKVTVISPTNWPDFLNWMPGCDKVLNYDDNAQRQKIWEVIMQTDWIFCLDFDKLSRTKRLAEVIEASNHPLILMDHHQQPEQKCFNYGISNSRKSSTCEMVYDLILATGNENKINSKIATCLYAGVVDDTGSFRYPSVTASVHAMVGYFKLKGLKHAAIHDHLYDNFSENRLRFTGHVLLNRMEIFHECNTALISISQEDILKFNPKEGDTGKLVNFLLTIRGIKLAAICIDKGEERKWSFRSKGNFDVNAFARTYFEGGGHPNASGAETNDSLENTIQKFLNAIEENAFKLQ
jgi:bifunctional oligoribonuclease and PAP phosphatase NrnA